MVSDLGPFVQCTSVDGMPKQGTTGAWLPGIHSTEESLHVETLPPTDIHFGECSTYLFLCFSSLQMCAQNPVPSLLSQRKTLLGRLPCKESSFEVEQKNKTKQSRAET